MVSEPTVSRYLKRLKGRQHDGNAQRWLAFLNNHREVIAAFDFFTISTLTFQLSTASLSSNMAGDAFFISTARRIRLPSGSYSN